MKTATYSIITTAIALTSLTGNMYFINNAMNAADVLTECARRENVFRCSLEPTPVTPKEQVEARLVLLPPPVI